MNTTTEEKSFWCQEAALDAILLGFRPKKIPTALVTYRAVLAVASETDSEVSPTHDGKPFQVTLLRISRMVCQPVTTTSARLRDFVRHKLLDTFTPPDDALTPFTLRLRTVKEDEQ